MKKIQKIFLLSFVLLINLLFLLGCSQNKMQEVIAPPDNSLQVHFLDVGQGDSILIQTPRRSENILIDGGPRDAGDKVVRYLQEHGVKKIDLLIATHPHEDHIGGLVKVLEAFPVKQIIDSGKKHTSHTYEKYLQLIVDKNIPLDVAPGQKINLVNGAQLDILGPMRYDYEDLNNYSVVSKLTYGKISFLFTGDMEKEAERDLRDKDLKANVLKIGHHGSRSSTSAHFLKQVAPKVAVISLGQGNDYGHPHAITLKKLAKIKAEIYRTDQKGTITVTTDGNNFEVTTEK